MQSPREGFTLIELLATVGVIAILAAFLAPVLMNAKATAMRTKCQSNLCQIGRAFESYTADCSGCYPNSNNQYLWAGFYWRDALRKYVRLEESAERSILSCPCDPTPPGIYAGTSYAYSASFYMSPAQVNRVTDGNHIRAKFAATNPTLPCSVVKTAAVKFSSKKAVVAEYWTLHSENIRVGWYDDPAETGNDPWSGARNYLFADGHVVYLQTRRIRAADSPLVTRARLLPDINLTRDGVAGRDVD
jgi:prepilin-type N-terminal cleavage/methylation domain-containing protein/prepilin-type processing-associated H-X9-DG protein